MKNRSDKRLGRKSLSDNNQRRSVRIARITVVSIFLFLFCWNLDSALAASPDSGWLATVQKKIRQQEYEASRNNRGLQAPNRAHNIRTYFSEKGIQVVDRSAQGSPGLLGLTLNGFGRGEFTENATSGNVALYHEGNRVELRREKLTEWFVNKQQGLEHGFDVFQKPPGEGELRLTLRVDGSTASVKPDGVIFKTPTGRVLKYDKLKVIDAGGKVLPSRFQMTPNNMIAILVDDGAADYPLTIDPLLTSTADAMVDSDQASANLGVSVSGAGDVNGDGYADVIVGAYFYDNGQNNEGAFFVYHGTASGINTVADTMVESDQADAWMGWSVSGAGDVNGDGYADVIVGAYGYDDGQNDEGAFFVYHGSAVGINTVADTMVESNLASAVLGFSVSGAGDVNGDGYADVIVGAQGYDNGQNDEGAFFVYHGSVTGINTAAAAMDESDQANAFLGHSVSGAGDVNGDGYADVIVGAHGYGNPVPASYEGAFFVYHGSAAGISTTADAVAESNQANAQLGWSLSGAGDVNGDGYADVIVGAYNYDNGENDEGAAFVYHGSAAGLNTVAAAMVEPDQINARMGVSVSGAGDVNGDGYADVIAGAYFYDRGENDEGAAFVYLGGDTGIDTTAAFMVESDQASAYMGYSVSGAGDVNGDGYADVIVGASGYDNGEVNEGAAFVYHGSAAGIDNTTASMVESDQANANLGVSVSGAGDVNGDGYGDVIVGAYNYDNGENDEGAAFVYHGSAAGIDTTADAMVESDQADAEFGWSVSSAGDVNGDGYGDVVVGAYHYDNGQSNEGAAFVYHGSVAGITTTADAMVESDQADAQLGYSVSRAGDVNGDGYSDVIVGAITYDNGENDEGAAFVYHGSAAGIGTTAAVMVESDQASAYMNSVSGAGDVNGDGYADVIVGARGYDNGQNDEGAFFVYHGSAAGISTTAAAMDESDQAYANLGFSVSGAGDVNGDGYADVIVGANRYDNGQNDEGAAFVYHGSASGINTTADAMVESDQASANLGVSVSGAGDVNGDGYADVIVGAYFYDNGQNEEGAAFVYHGSAAGIDTTADAMVESDQADAQLGYSVSGAGDVNGDGYADVIAGAYFYDSGENDEGAAFVYYGNSEGRTVMARQLRGNGGTETVAPWGGSYDPDGFQVRIQATSPKGRERVKMQVEYCPCGVPFEDPSCDTHTSSDWTEVSGSGVVLTEAIAGLNLGERYRWRARILYAPFMVTQAGITEPPSPEYGPWRRVDAQSDEADILIDDTPAASGNSGNSGGGGGGGICFISVAAAGSQIAPHVKAPGNFRDGYQFNNSRGKIIAALGLFLVLVIAGLVIPSKKLRDRSF